MANATYPLAKQRILERTLGLAAQPAGAATLKIIAVSPDYVFSVGHESIADVDPLHIVGPATDLTGVTVANGVVDAVDPTIEGMTQGATLDALIVYAEWADSSLLLAYMDSPGDATIPQTINSPKGLIVFDAQGIFRI